MKNCTDHNYKSNDPQYIYNPKTGRWVKKNGDVGKKIIHDQSESEQNVDNIGTQIAIKKPPINKKIVLKIKQPLQSQCLPNFHLVKNNSIYYFIHSSDQNPKKLAVFDLDGTLIKTLSGEIFATSADDWMFNYPEVPQILRNLVNQGYQLIIISNQAGISSGHTSLNLITEKLEKIYLSLKLPLQIYLSTQKDSFRKPMTDIWDFCLATNQLSSQIDGFYCGDAAGRPKGYLPNQPKDFNITDRYFAHNINLSFLTPEECFIPIGPFPYNDVYEKSLSLSQYYPKTTYPLPDISKESNKNLIIIVGSPASGKTTLTQSMFSDYVALSNDVVKNSQKLKKMFVESVQNNQNIIIDNTHPERNSRAYYINIAKTNNYHVFCYFFNFPKLFVMHLNQMRIQMTHGGKIVPDIAIHTYYKKLEKPTTDEGFLKVLEISQLHFTSSNLQLLDQFNRYYYYKYDI